ncbi:preprotein translocase subunit SecE [Spiroplasma endosymbiont of Amphibalanus improvisus]|uniref:preprotein translocase subunit SecE n=1 Tax=Spiroplasma endosymbiont of Amphibalanus improvisus TaxID=3066327 RepID=UPI00313B4567
MKKDNKDLNKVSDNSKITNDKKIEKQEESKSINNLKITKDNDDLIQSENLNLKEKNQTNNKKQQKIIKAGFKEDTAEKQKTRELKEKRKKEKKIQKNSKEKKNYKLAIREFPTKFINEIKRIRWAGKGSLARKFLIVMAFILFFIIFYVIIDALFTYLLGISKIIN